MASIISVVGGLTWAKQMDLPSFPFVLFVMATLVGLIVYFKNKYKDGTYKFDWKQILSWGVKGFVIGAGIWVLYIIVRSIFNFGEIPLISGTFPAPGTGLDPTGVLYDIDDLTGEEVYHWENLILPALTLGIRPLAIVTQLTRSSMLDVLSQDYIRTAKAKGLSFYKVVVKHSLKNALNPVITAISGWFASLLAGSVFVENVFSWNGIGNALVDALRNDDLPIVMGVVVVIATFFVVIQILVDIIYGMLDPRIRVK